MKENTEIDFHIQQTLDVANRLQQVEVNPYLYSKVMHRLQQTENVKEGYSFFPKWGIALATIMLVANGLSFTAFAVKSHQFNKQAAISAIANDYGQGESTISY